MPKNYAEEAAYYANVLEDHGVRGPRTLLELGSGGGNNASHLKRRFTEVTLVDRSEGMLAVSRHLNPDCEHVQGDMREVRLGRTFDCVFVHDAVCYVTTALDLRRVAGTVAAHLAPGGTALLAPDFVRETFESMTSHGGSDGEDGRGLRFVEWSWDPDVHDTTYRVEYAILLRERDGTVQVHHDTHVEGLFSIDEWIACLRSAGLAARALRHRHSDEDLDRVVFACRSSADVPDDA